MEARRFKQAGTRFVFARDAAARGSWRPALRVLMLCLIGVLCGTLGAQQDGSLDATYDPSSSGEFWDIAVRPNGQALVIGMITPTGGTSSNQIAQLNADGSVDTTFNPGSGLAATFPVFAVGRALALQPDGKVLVGGTFETVDGVSRPCLARLNTDGSVDTSFDAGTFTSTGLTWGVQAVAVQPDGRILVGGTFEYINGTFRSKIARLNADGSVDTSFDPGLGGGSTGGGQAAVSTIIVQPDDKILISGGFDLFDGAPSPFIERLNPDGSRDTGFVPGNGGPSAGLHGMALQPDGKIVIVGNGVVVAGVGVIHPHVSRFNPDGSVDATFNPGTGPGTGTLATPFSVALQPNGKILMGGQFTSFNHVLCNRIVRLNSDGSYDTSFVTGLGAEGGSSPSVRAIEIQSDGNILIAGKFDSVDGVSRGAIARLYNGQAPVAPSFTSTAVDTAIAGQAYSYTATADGAPIPTLSAPILPGWLNFNTATGELTGTPQVGDIGTAGNYVVIEATSSSGSVAQGFAITVDGVSPTITSAPVSSATLGVSYSYTAVASGIPAPTLSVGALPSWLTFNAVTGELSGTPTAIGLSTIVEITAANGWAPDDLQSFQIQVNGTAPQIVSTPPAQATIASLYTYDITATGSPAPSFSVSGAPSWLNLSGSVLSGTPAAGDAGLTSTITITAANGQGTDAVQAFTIDVSPAVSVSGGGNGDSGGCVTRTGGSNLPVVALALLFLTMLLLRTRKTCPRKSA